jgi:hypothetical protein
MTIKERIERILHEQGPLQVSDIAKQLMVLEGLDPDNAELRAKRTNCASTVLYTNLGKPFVKADERGVFGLPEHHLHNGGKMQEIEHSCLVKLLQLMIALGDTADEKVHEIGLVFNKVEDDYLINLNKQRSDN